MPESYWGAVLGIQDVETRILLAKCQRFAPMSKAHHEELTIMTSLRPFVIWGIDLIVQLLKGRDNIQYPVVAVDYFTK